MNVFEDLIVELKEENLLEETVLDVKGAASEPGDTRPAVENLSEIVSGADTPPVVPEAEGPHVSAPQIVGNDEVPEGRLREKASGKPKKEKSGKGNAEFFKKRAVAEVSSLQMVEHVLTAVEREYMKHKPNSFDDFNVKRALNAFLQASDADKEELKAAEFALMQQTEAWYTSLAARDASIAVQNLRQYCENTRPALSSQALLSLARFYRNSPYSEAVRAKFDFVITRLFSRPIGAQRRKPLFERSEALGHLNTLYREWSSVPLYSADDDLSKIELTALSFDDLTAEAEAAAAFDDLLESDFFGRLRLFKESISELFFAPEVAIAAIVANVSIGNAYVKLIDQERAKMDAERVQSKYAGLDDQTVSDAAARTLELVQILQAPFEPEPEEFEEEEPDDDPREKIIFDTSASRPYGQKVAAKEAETTMASGIKRGFFGINKWLLVVSFLLVSSAAGFYVWANYFINEKPPGATVQNVNLDNAVFKEHLKMAKVTGETFHGVLLPSWDTLSKGAKEEYLKKIYQAGPSMGFKQVSLLTKDGKQAGFASATRMEIDE